MANPDMAEAAQRVAEFYDELGKHEIYGSAAEKIVTAAAPTIVSYVLYHHTTFAN